MEEKNQENVLKKLLKKEVIISLVVGLVLGLIIMFFVANGVEGYVSGKLLTEGSLYGKMKQYFSIDLVLDNVDKTILNKKYKLEDEDLNELRKTADDYIKEYEAYGYTKDEFLKGNGFESYDEFVEQLSLDYKRSLYVYDYLATQLEDNAVQEYYDEHAFGKVNTKHILVKFSDDMTENKALKLAKEIITKLDKDEDFDTLATEYTTNYEGTVKTEDLGEKGAFDFLEDAYVEGMKELEAGEYSKKPVKTSYGYHVIYCVDKKEKTEKISFSDKMAIIGVLATEAELILDEATYYKALIEMRDEAGLKFFDKNFKEKYEEYCKPYVEVEDNETQDNETELNISIETEE